MLRYVSSRLPICMQVRCQKVGLSSSVNANKGRIKPVSLDFNNNNERIMKKDNNNSNNK